MALPHGGTTELPKVTNTFVVFWSEHIAVTTLPLTLAWFDTSLCRNAVYCNYSMNHYRALYYVPAIYVTMVFCQSQLQQL